MSPDNPVAHAFVPRFILEKLAEGEKFGQFETVGCFVDVVGFSQMTSTLMAQGQHGAEVLAQVMRSIYEGLVAEVYGQGGFITHFAGDAFTAIFPGESSDAQLWRALSAAWRMQRRLKSQASVDTEYGTFAIAAKVALAAGPVEWGVLQSGEQAAYYFRGPAVDDAAAVEKYAAAGSIVVEGSLGAAVNSRFASKAAGPHFQLCQQRGPLRQPDPINLSTPSPALTAHFLPADVVAGDYIGEFRHVVNVFIKLHGKLDREQLDEFMGQLFQLQRQYGGLLSRIDFGDKGTHLLMFWGAPQTFENDIPRALSFVLELQNRAAVPLNAGITYRIGHAGPIGSALRAEFTCYGSGVNLAARLMSHGQAGQILVDREIARRAQLFELEQAGEPLFKGFSQPEAIFTVEGRQTEGHGAVNARRFQGQLVGRQQELAWLKERCASLATKSFAGFHLIRGEAGLGKSQLVHHFLAGRPDVQAFICQSDEIVRAPLNPMRYWLRRYFGQVERQGKTANRAAFESRLEQTCAAAPAELAAELRRTRSFLAALVGLYWPGSLFAQLEAEGRQENTRQALIALLQAEAARQPAVLVIEDIQWLDIETAAFLTDLAVALELPAARSLPLVVLLTGRSELPVLIPDNLPVNELHLTKLGEEALDELLRLHLNGPVTDELRHMLQERGGGNPFFASQIVAFLEAENLLEQGPAGWQLRASGTTLPADLRALLVARLDRLDRPVRRLVEHAAVLGREFELPVVAEMVGGAGDCQLFTQRAVEQAILSQLENERYLFQHALLRDAAYDVQVQSRRRRRHAKAVAALETLYEQELASHYPALAYHSDLAAASKKARHYFRLAGDQARANYSNLDARTYYAKGLAHTPASETRLHAELALALAGIEFEIGDKTRHEAGLDDIQEIIGMTQDDGLAAQLNLLACKWLAKESEFEAALHLASSTQTQAEAAKDTRSAIDSLRLSAFALRKLGRIEEAQKRLELARSIAEESEEIELAGYCQQNLGLIAHEAGKFFQAHLDFKSAFELFETIDSKAGIALAANSLGMTCIHLGRFFDARHHLETALDLFHTIGSRSNEGLVLTNLGTMFERQGLYEESLDAYALAVTFHEQGGHDTAVALCWQNRGVIAGKLGQLDEAFRLLSLANDKYARSADKFGLALSGFSLGMVLHDLGRVDEALSALQEAKKLAQTIGALEFIAGIENEQGHILLSLENSHAAAKHFRSALQLAQTISNESYRVEASAGIVFTAHQQRKLAMERNRLSQLVRTLQATPELANAERPMRAYAYIIESLLSIDKTTSMKLCQVANEQLNRKAGAITNQELRQHFYTNVPDNAHILALANRLESK